MHAASPEAPETRSYALLTAGDPAPWFHQRSGSNPRYTFSTAAGRYIVLGFFMSAGDAVGRACLEAVTANRGLFDDDRACFFGVSVDPRDEPAGHLQDQLPGIRFFLDFDGQVSRLYGALPQGDEPDARGLPVRRFWAVLDPTLRVMKVMPMAADGADRANLFTYLESLPPPTHFAGFEVAAPVLVLPNVFEPELCRQLIGIFEAEGGRESGFMREVDGKTVQLHDPAHKRRKDCEIADLAIRQQLQARILRRIVPEIAKVHQFKVTRMERYLVACYAAEDQAHFRAHRDNTTKGTAHRRFAVSINLNAEFAGGEVSFPEYGPRSFKPPPGGAVVFSCSLLHAVSAVTSGRRYAFLPFLYDDEAARLRQANNQFLAASVGEYQGA